MRRMNRTEKQMNTMKHNWDQSKRLMLRLPLNNWEEFTNLIKLLESRVVECTIPRICAGVDQSEGNVRVIAEKTAVLRENPTVDFNVSSRQDSLWLDKGLGSFSPGTSFGNTTPDLCISAVMAAKKWKEERKLKSSTTPQSVHGPRALKAFESPIDVAKSYMRTRPSWSSASASSMGIITPPGSRSHHSTDGSPSTAFANSTATYKATKRNSFAIESRENHAESRNVRHKIANIVDLFPVSGEADSSGKAVKLANLSDLGDENTRSQEQGNATDDHNTPSQDDSSVQAGMLDTSHDRPNGVQVIDDTSHRQDNVVTEGQQEVIYEPLECTAVGLGTGNGSIFYEYSGNKEFVLPDGVQNHIALDSGGRRTQDALDELLSLPEELLLKESSAENGSKTVPDRRELVLKEKIIDADLSSGLGTPVVRAADESPGLVCELLTENSVDVPENHVGGLEERFLASNSVDTTTLSENKVNPTKKLVKKHGAVKEQVKEKTSRSRKSRGRGAWK